MGNKKMMPKYEAGERACAICSESLPAHQTWAGAKYRICGKPECVAIAKAKKGGRYINPNERKCHGEECEAFVPSGWYAHRPIYLSCSADCWHRRFVKGDLITPRPLTTSDLDSMLKLLHERGNSCLRLAAAIAEVSGLRIGEICRLRVADVDVIRQRFFVASHIRSCRRWAFFTEETNDSWSTLRLRHTMALNMFSAGVDAPNVMAAGGWKSYETTVRYHKVGSSS
jgi:hypothetical protein